uniref:C-type lectin domain-containing protein n=1 Tax=Oncorhynchus mykiss TaxID=8022 RepID=A0A8K9X8U2_ONCMY
MMSIWRQNKTEVILQDFGPLSTSPETDKLVEDIFMTVSRMKEVSEQTCPAGWQKFESSWYFLSTETKTWKESREDCLERGADLVIINSDKEQSTQLQCLAKVFGPLELCDLLPHFRLQT